ncbi:hypothetical protein J6590_077284 [Homalodisca vitripennis]|nr:hypothetical protein J6590_077284 [Homalodisca vitripennis]
MPSRHENSPQTCATAPPVLKPFSRPEKPKSASVLGFNSHSKRFTAFTGPEKPPEKFHRHCISKASLAILNIVMHLNGALKY